MSNYSMQLKYVLKFAYPPKRSFKTKMFIQINSDNFITIG